jgi:hypothetical protein
VEDATADRDFLADPPPAPKPAGSDWADNRVFAGMIIRKQFLGTNYLPPSHTMVTPPSKADDSCDTAQKLRQTQAEYTAARPAKSGGAKVMMSSAKLYVCRRCQANFKTGEGKPDARLRGMGKCNRCLASVSAAA